MGIFGWFRTGSQNTKVSGTGQIPTLSQGLKVQVGVAIIVWCYIQ